MGSNEPSPAISPLPTQQRLGQARGRILLHDARCALGTDHALVERVIGIAVDVADLAVFQMHANAAATGAHVAGGDLDFGAQLGVPLGEARHCAGPPAAGQRS